MLAFHCDYDLEDIIIPSNMRKVVHAVVTTAKREGWLIKLVEGAHAANSGNKLLKELHAETQAFLLEFEIESL